MSFLYLSLSFLQKRGGNIRIRPGHGVKAVGLASIRTKLTRWRQYTQKESLRRLKDLPSIESYTMMQTHFCRLLITGDGDAHNPVSGQVSVKVEVCRGSLLCTNGNCPFLKIEKKPNKADFIRGDRCMHCNAAATETPCTARKYVENDRCHKTITVIYLYTHSCNPRKVEDKPQKETLEDILRSQPTKTAGQIQLDVIREALLSDKCGDEVNNVALSYSNRMHIQYVKNTIDKEKRPGGSDIEAFPGELMKT